MSLCARAVALPREPILIVGGGPVGLTAALALARHGVASRILEADEDVCDGSRAICLSARSLQILQRLGCAEPFLAKGLAWSEGRSYLGRQEVFHLRLPRRPDDRFPPFINIQQHHAERILADACAASGLVDLQRGSAVVEMRSADCGVEVRAVREGQALTYAAPWLVAADGARSFVRETGLGLALEGRSFEHRYLIADVALECDWPTERRVWFDPRSNPGSTVIMHRQPDGLWRIDYQLAPDEDPDKALLDAEVRARIDAHLDLVGLRGPWTLVWKSLYRAHALTLADYVHGRVAFAGDAAHLVPIFGVRGLNSGLEDAINLAWKLALVAQGQAPPALLDAYTRERRGACLANLEAASKSTLFMSPPTSGYILARDAVLELALEHAAFRPLVDPRQSGPDRYVDAAAQGAPSHPLVGYPLPEARIASGAWMHDQLGRGFSLIRVVTDGDLSQAWTAQLTEVRLRDDDPAAAILGLRGSAAILVRPDAYVAAVLDPADPAAAHAALRASLGLVAAHTSEVRVDGTP
jgi:3-(3-hydroxy-phenyl)propionate hydroxylase